MENLLCMWSIIGVNSTDKSSCRTQQSWTATTLVSHN